VVRTAQVGGAGALAGKGADKGYCSTAAAALRLASGKLHDHAQTDRDALSSHSSRSAHGTYGLRMLFDLETPKYFTVHQMPLGIGKAQLHLISPVPSDEP
jgi:hypothetical protein